MTLSTVPTYRCNDCGQVTLSDDHPFGWFDVTVILMPSTREPNTGHACSPGCAERLAVKLTRGLIGLDPQGGRTTRTGEAEG